MRQPARFPYERAEGGRIRASDLAYLPVTLTHGSQSLTVPALLDSGSTPPSQPPNKGVQPTPLASRVGFLISAALCLHTLQ